MERIWHLSHIMNALGDGVPCHGISCVSAGLTVQRTAATLEAIIIYGTARSYTLQSVRAWQGWYKPNVVWPYNMIRARSDRRISIIIRFPFSVLTFKTIAADKTWINLIEGPLSAWKLMLKSIFDTIYLWAHWEREKQEESIETPR